MAERIDRGASRALWLRASTFQELCELGARFCLGELAHFPGWGVDVLDAESIELEPVLARLNRSGFLTTCSQPGVDAPERELRQRAFVAGFADAAWIEVARTRVRAAGLRLAVLEPGAELSERIPVTIERGLVRVELGAAPHAAELACFEDDLAPEVLAVLARMPWVAVWDERFGASTRLWDALDAR